MKDFAEICRFAICDLRFAAGTLEILRVGDCVISRRICGFSFMRSVKKVFLPTSVPVKDHGGIGPCIFLIFYILSNILDIIQPGRYGRKKVKRFFLRGKI